MRAPTRRFVLWIALAVAVAGLGSPRAGSADDAAATPPWYEAIQVNGFLSSSYSYNFNRPDSRTNTLRVFDFDDNAFKLDLFELAVQRAVSKPRESGFRADFAFGSSVPRVSAAQGLFRDDTGTAGDLDLQQAYATYVAPLGSGLRLDMGKFVTHFGSEVIEGYDGWNDNATRSLLFGYAIPFTHTGMHATYAISPRASGTVLVVNGWDNARDNNRAKSLGAQLAITPARPLTILLNAMTGPERTGNNSDPRTLLDAVVICKATPRLTLGVNGDWGTEQDAVKRGADAHWSGVAGYVRLAPGRSWALSLRGETLDDRDGARTGVSQFLSEATLTPELRLGPGMLVRADLRVDRSNRSVFEKGKGPSDSQTTVLVSVLCSF